MIELVYVSQATGPMHDDALRRVLRQARRNNAERDVTGALVYLRGRFAQVLEGRAEVVEPLFERIRVDPRHVGVRVVSHRPVEQRSFPEWTMAYLPLETVGEPDDVEGFDAFLLDQARGDRDIDRLLPLLMRLRHLASRSAQAA